jgi:hypothetical protein
MHEHGTVGWAFSQISADQLVQGREPVQTAMHVANGIASLAGGQACRRRDEINHERTT